MKRQIIRLLRRAAGTQQIIDMLDQLHIPGSTHSAGGAAACPEQQAGEGFRASGGRDRDNSLIDEVLTMVRREYTVMPRFGFHQPLDYNDVTLPPKLAGVEQCVETGLSIPTGDDRFGYSPEDTGNYLKWGRYDHDQIMAVIVKHSGEVHSASILDFGCSSGRVLRHFEKERGNKDWKLFGCDVQARAIEWMRVHLPRHFNVITSSILPHLPYEDATFDCIYGFSVFTHIKYQWDAWLMELRRVLKPGGLLIQTIHTETAWEKYHMHRNESWVKNGHSPRVYNTPKMDVDFLLHGDVSVSQVFWKKGDRNEVLVQVLRRAGTTGSPGILFPGLDDLQEAGRKMIENLRVPPTRSYCPVFQRFLPCVIFQSDLDFTSSWSSPR